MSEAAAQTRAPPPEAQIAEILLSQLVPRMVHLAATLKLPSHLAQGAKTAEELAPMTATDAPALYRVMRSLAGLGFFAEDADIGLACVRLAQFLSLGRPATPPHSFSEEKSQRAAWTGSCIRSRRAAPALSSLSECLCSIGWPLIPCRRRSSTTRWWGSRMEPPAIASAYDFSAFQTIADVGGSTGNLLATILSKHPGPRGILFDLPHVVRDAPALIQRRGLGDHIRAEGGNSLRAFPPEPTPTFFRISSTIGAGSSA